MSRSKSNPDELEAGGEADLLGLGDMAAEAAPPSQSASKAALPDGKWEI